MIKFADESHVNIKTVKMLDLVTIILEISQLIRGKDNLYISISTINIIHNFLTNLN